MVMGFKYGLDLPPPWLVWSPSDRRRGYGTAHGQFVAIRPCIPTAGCPHSLSLTHLHGMDYLNRSTATNYIVSLFCLGTTSP